MQRVIAYVDGFNFYYSLRELRWERFYWLNFQCLALKLLQPLQELKTTKYFTTIVGDNEGKRRRQGLYIDALKTLDNFEIYYGHFLSDTIECQKCGHIHQTHHEKMTDVNIAVQMLTDAYQDNFDIAMLITADSDLTNAIVMPCKPSRA